MDSIVQDCSHSDLEIQILDLKYKITKVKEGTEEICNELRHMFSDTRIYSSHKPIDIITNKALENGIMLKKTLNFRFYSGFA